MSHTFLVVGLGTFGGRVAEALFRGGAYVLAVDREEERVNLFRESASKTIRADATDTQAMTAIGAFDVDCAIVALRNHFDATVLVTHALRKNGISRILVQVDNEQEAEAIQIFGATEVIFPPRDMALRLAKRLIHPDLIESLLFGSDFGLIDIPCPEAFVDHTIRELALRTRHGVTLIGIRKASSKGEEEEFLFNISPDTRMEATFHLLLLGNHEQLTRIRNIARQARSR
ncbi:MAG: TrkA family potassium uptake protein [Magnetococcales bacterium]|nr:TrkA family potassium uptake protein [Magnetococcales bacterium]